MAATSGSGGGNVSTSPAAMPLATEWQLALDSAINFIMIEATLGAVEVVMLLALLFFSTSVTRRKPIFLLNILALFLGITVAVNNLYLETYSLKYPTGTIHPANVILTAVLSGNTAIFIDFVLLLRLHAVFPPRTTGLKWYTIIMGIPVLINLGRLANSLYYTAQYARNVTALANSSDGGVTGGAVLDNSSLPSVKVEWALQIVADLYSSTLFLSRFNGRTLLRSNVSFSRKICTLFWLSVCNFVLPVMLSLAQLVVYVTSPDLYDVAEYIGQVNDHVTIICVVFATIWAFQGSWEESRSNSARGIPLRQFGNSSGSEDIEPAMKFRVRASGPPDPEASALYDKPRFDATMSSSSPTSSQLEESRVEHSLDRLEVAVAEKETGQLDLHGTVLSRIGQAV